jgi:hypothetical protein
MSYTVAVNFETQLRKWATKAVTEDPWTRTYHKFDGAEHAVDPDVEVTLILEHLEGYSYSEYTSEPSSDTYVLSLGCTCGWHDTLSIYPSDIDFTSLLKAIVEAT